DQNPQSAEALGQHSSVLSTRTHFVKPWLT
ncbi:unnamed protein product, partial [marine sediment metagenome]